MARITLLDVAKAAGVGVATVDRVLNKRAPVSSETAQRVLAAAESLGYHARGLLRRRLEEMAPVLRFGVILQKQSKWFYQSLAESLRATARETTIARIEIEITFVEALSPDDLSMAIRKFKARVDGLVLVSIDHPEVHAAIAESAGEGVAVLPILSPVPAPGVAGYVGIDGRKAGRTAGLFMSRFLPEGGEIGLLIGSHRYIGHEDREAGFRGYVCDTAPQLRLRDSVVFLDDRSIAYEAMSELLTKSPHLKGVYNCGGGVSGMIRAIRESGRSVTYICHENSPQCVEALRDGIVDILIATPQQQIAQQAIILLTDMCLGRQVPETKLLLPFQITTAESV